MKATILFWSVVLGLVHLWYALGYSQDHDGAGKAKWCAWVGGLLLAAAMVVMVAFR